MRTAELNVCRPAIERGAARNIYEATPLDHPLTRDCQTTISRPVTLEGIGVHSGRAASITLQPAGAGAGITFRRNGPTGAAIEIPASFNAVSAMPLCTKLGDQSGNSVATVEHLLAATYGLGIDNLAIEIEGPEVPILDGSARGFVEAIDASGIDVFEAPRTFIKILKPVRIHKGPAWGELRPYPGLFMDVEIFYDAPVIGHQRLAIDMCPRAFRSEVSCARTFGFANSVAALWADGRALGASLENTVAIDHDQVVNRGGLRYPDEFVRHKTLDALGDLSLAGAPMLGAYRSFCGGHDLNQAMLDELFSDPTAWTMVEASSVGGLGAVRAI
jgi:UDP-3-O-[3-hydroxymyristoyl] N-acetylglucosamine deacetylase